MANEASFDIRVDTVRKSIVWCSIGENTDEYGMYAKKARTDEQIAQMVRGSLGESMYSGLH